MCSIPCWKKIYQTIGSTYNVTEDDIVEVLRLSQDDLLEGLLIYKPFTKRSFDQWCDKAKVDPKAIGMKQFIFDLSEKLNLDATITYPLLRNYILFEYYGKNKEFLQVTRSRATLQLERNVWNFYTAERMFLLKTWRHILEYANDDLYQFSEQYSNFLKVTKKDELIDNLIKQFEIIAKQLTASNLDWFRFKDFNQRDQILKFFLCRNIREQAEILSVLTLVMQRQPLTTTQLSKVLMLFIHYDFDAVIPMKNFEAHIDPKIVDELMYTKIGCYFVVLQNYWEDENPIFWTSSIIKNMDKYMMQDAHSVFTCDLPKIAWLFLKFKAKKNQQAGQEALELFTQQPFTLLQSMVSCDIFKKCLFGEVVIKACHKLLDEICLMYSDRNGLYREKGLTGTVAEFLTREYLIGTLMKSRNGLDSIMDIAIQTFPYDFFTFTTFARSLLGHQENYKPILTLLNNLPFFLSDITWTNAVEDYSILRNSHTPLVDSDLIVFPPRTTVRQYAILDERLVQYESNYSYFIYLEYLLNTMISDGLEYRKLEPEIVKKVIAGFEVVVESIKMCRDLDFTLIGLTRILQRFNKVIINIRGRLSNAGLVKVYFDVQNALMVHRESNFFDTCPQAVRKVFFPQLKPENFLDVEESLFKYHLFDEPVFEKTTFMELFEEERYQDDHSLVSKYIKILNNVMKVLSENEKFQLSGVAFVVRYVFVQHETWPYKNENQKTEITVGCLKIFHSVLQKNFKEYPEAQDIFKLCQHVFFNNLFLIDTFLKLFIKEQNYLAYSMERESNWIAGPMLERLASLRIQLAVLLLVMNRRKALEEVAECPWDKQIRYVAKPVASFFTNSYSPIVAELSCRFLEKLANDPNIPLLALLELDHGQVQVLFLDRLRDRLEEENVKVAIIDLINVCISKQNGMTAAFFNLKCFLYWDETRGETPDEPADETEQSVCDFLLEYLQNIRKSPDYFKNPLQLGMLRLLHSLWFNHMETLISNVSSLEDFWPLMTLPLFVKYNQEVEVYTLTLKIINLQLTADSDAIDARLISIVKKFFEDGETVRDWISFLLDTCTNSPPSASDIQLLHAWTELVVVAKKITKESISPEIRVVLMNSCLQGMNMKGGGLVNAQPIYVWSRLYLILLHTWPPLDMEEQRYHFTRIAKCVASLVVYYSYLKPKHKETMLGVIYLSIEKSAEYNRAHFEKFMSFLSDVGKITEIEFTGFIDALAKKNDQDKCEWMRPWVICMFISKLVMSFNVDPEQIAEWFFNRKYLRGLLDSVSPMMANRSTLPFAKFAVDFMITYAKSLGPASRDFLEVDLFMFYYNLEFPSICLSIVGAITHGIPANLRELWLLLTLLVRLLRILLQTLDNKIFDTCFQIVQRHSYLFYEMVSLTKYVTDLTALNLVCDSIILMYEILKRKPGAILAYSPFGQIMDGVKITMNASVLAITKCKRILFYKIDSQGRVCRDDDAPNELLGCILNKLNQIVCWASLCLNGTKPSLTTLLHIQDLPDDAILFIENTVTASRFQGPLLTYSTLFLLAEYLCKLLAELSTKTAAPAVKKIESGNLGEIFNYWAGKSDQWIGFMVYIHTDELIDGEWTTFIHCDVSDFSDDRPTSVTPQLHYETVKLALESLMNLLACEIFCSMHRLPEEGVIALKRDIVRDVKNFYNFVRMKIAARCSDYDFFLVISHFLMKFCNLST